MFTQQIFLSEMVALVREHSLTLAYYVRIWDLCGQMSKKYTVPRSSGAPMKVYNMTSMTARANLT